METCGWLRVVACRGWDEREFHRTVTIVGKRSPLSTRRFTKTFIFRGDDQVLGVVEVEGCARRDDCGGAVFGDDGGSGVFLAGAEFFSPVNLRFLFFAFEYDRGFGRREPAELYSEGTDGGGCPHMAQLCYMVR